MYSGKVWQVQSLANRLQSAKLKSSQLVVTINNPLADLFICQTFFHQALEKSRFAKHSLHQTFHYTVHSPVDYVYVKVSKSLEIPGMDLYIQKIEDLHSTSVLRE